MFSRAELGRFGEDETARRLERRGYRILGRNVRVGRFEIDILALRGSTLVAVEVRARSTDHFGHPAETVDRAKQSRLRSALLRWASSRPFRCDALRNDVAALVVDGAGRVRSFRYYANAF